MKRANIEEIMHGSTNTEIKNCIESVPSVRIVSRLDEALESREMTQIQLSAITGIRPSTISDYVNGNKSVVNKAHLMAIMVALRLTDVTQILSIEYSDEVTAQFKQEEKKWIKERIKPQGVSDLYKKNVLSKF